MGKQWALQVPTASAEEGIVAYIEERRYGWLVVWREHGKKLSRSFRCGYQVTNFDEGGPDEITVTREAAHRFTVALADEKKKVERAYRRPLDRVNAQDYPEGSPGVGREPHAAERHRITGGRAVSYR